MLEDLIKSKISEIIDCIDFNLFSSLYDRVVDFYMNLLLKYPDNTPTSKFSNDPIFSGDAEEIIDNIIDDVLFDYELFRNYIAPKDVKECNVFHTEYILNEYISNYTKSSIFREKIDRQVIPLYSDIFTFTLMRRLIGDEKFNEENTQQLTSMMDHTTIYDFKEALATARILNPYKLFTYALINVTRNLYERFHNGKNANSTEDIVLLDLVNKSILKELDMFCDNASNVLDGLYKLFIKNSSSKQLADIIVKSSNILMSYQVGINSKVYR